MRASKHSVRSIGLDFYVRCQSPRCMSAAVLYADQLIPLCLEHAEAIYRHLCDALPGPSRRRYRRTVDRSVARATTDRAEVRPSVVYYARIGEHVKIGYSGSPGNRWRALANQYGPEDVSILVVEPGGQPVEFRRQAEFAHLRVGVTELFRLDATLAAHIAELIERRPDWIDLARETHQAWKAAASGPGLRRGNMFIPGAAPRAGEAEALREARREAGCKGARARWSPDKERPLAG